MNLHKGPLIIAVCGIFFGILIAVMFGANEDFFQDKIQNGLKLNSKIQQIENPDAKAAAIEKESSKNWRYYQRFHFHSSAIGSMSVALLLLLSFIQVPKKISKGLAWLMATSGCLYPFVWLFAAIYGPIIGRGVAKEKFAIFGYMGGVYLVCVLTMIYLLSRYSLGNSKNA